MKSMKKERTLAYKASKLIEDMDLHKISGGSAIGTTTYTTKQSVDSMGNYDVGGDVQWDV